MVADIQEKKPIKKNLILRILLIVSASIDTIVAILLILVCCVSFLQPIIDFNNYNAVVLKGEDRTEYYAISTKASSNDVAEFYNKDKFSDFMKNFLNSYKTYIMYDYIPISEDGVSVQCCVSNENFMDLYNFPITEGRYFESNDFDYKFGDTVPILVGSN